MPPFADRIMVYYIDRSVKVPDLVRRTALTLDHNLNTSWDGQFVLE